MDLRSFLPDVHNNEFWNVAVKGLTGSGATLATSFRAAGAGAGTAGPTGFGGGHNNVPFSKIMLPRTTSSSKLI